MRFIRPGCAGRWSRPRVEAEGGAFAKHDWRRCRTMVVTAWVAPKLVAVARQSHRRDASLWRRGRTGVLAVHAPWAPAGHPLGAGEALNVPACERLALALGYPGTQLPMFCVGCSYGSALPRPAGADPNPYTAVHPHRARANPYTAVHPQRARGRGKRRAGARHPEMARMRCEISLPTAGSGGLGAPGDGGIQGDAAALQFARLSGGE